MTVKAWDKPEEDKASRAQTSNERPKFYEAKQDEAVLVSKDRSNKRPGTCKAYHVPLIVTRDNDSMPDVEHTSFGKIINRRVCSANLARDKNKAGIKKGTFKSSLDPEFLKMFD
jgi:hypothetical protein